MKDELRQIGYSSNAIRSIDDLYITPDGAIKAIIEKEKKYNTFSGLGWECACGNGAISKFFKEYPNFISSDIRDNKDVYGYGNVDFLETDIKVNFIITNPPFKLMLEFAEHAIELADKVILFGRIQFLEGIKRHKFFMKYPPIRIYVFSNRIICRNPFDTDLNSGIMCFAWYIWQKNFKGFTTLDWIMTDKD